MFDIYEKSRSPYGRFRQDSNPKAENHLMAILKNAAELKLTRNKNFMRLLYPASINYDPSLLEALNQQVKEELLNRMFDSFPFEQPTESVSTPRPGSRPLLIGRIRRHEQRPFMYDSDLLNQHMLILGSTGSGKTSLIYLIILQAMRYGIPALIFDSDKNDFRHLLRFQCAKDLVVVRAKDFPINFLQPPKDVDRQDWIVVLSMCFCKYNALLEGSEGFFIREMTSLYHDYGVFEGKDTYPTLYDLHEKILHVKVKGNSRSSQFKDSILNRLDSYLALNQKASAYSKAVPIDWIASRKIVIEMSGLTERMSRFYSAVLLQALFRYRIASGMRGNFLRNIVVMDECKTMTPPGYNPNLSFSPLSMLMSQAREAGIGLVLADQSAQLESSVFVNSRCKVCFRLGDGADIRKVAQSFSLSKEQEGYIPKLDIGECIVRIPGEDPFVIETLPVNIE